MRHVGALKTGTRIVFGVVWLVDDAFEFQPGVADSLPETIAEAAAGQPAWLQPGFIFWSGVVSSNPSFFATSIGVLELALGLSLVLGLLRKVAYTGGRLLSLVIWSVPEGCGGADGPSSADIGTGIIYDFAFLLLMIVNATYDPARLSLDAALERRWPAWSRVAEFRSDASRTYTQSP